MASEVLTDIDPTTIRAGDELKLQGEGNDWTPPIASVETTEEGVVIGLGEGQPGPFTLTLEVPVTVRRPSGGR